jgi:type I restriction enzyme S subunit
VFKVGDHDVKPVIASGEFITFRSRHCDPDFLAYRLQSSDVTGLLTASAKSVTRSHQRVDPATVRSIELPEIPIEEQRRIAEFLDRETAQIDALIAKQQQLISTLAERFEARWTDVFEELGRSFKLTPIRRVIQSIVDGPFGSSLTSAHYVEEGHRVVRLGNIGVWSFKDVDKAYIDPEYAASLASHAVKAGDVLVAGLGDEKMPLGRACVAPVGLGPAIVKADCYRVRPTRRVEPEFLAWALSSPPVREQFGLLSRGTTRSRLNTTVVRDARIPVPSIEEQKRVVGEFAELAIQHENLAASANEVKSLLAERRQALISAAVTGKINVGGAST